MNWTKTKPTVPGVYWVLRKEEWSGEWQPARAVEVEDGGRQGLVAWVPFMDFADPLHHPDYDNWEGCLWCGPIERPAPPLNGEST